MSTAVMWSKSKPDVEFQYGGRLGEFDGMSSQSHLPHCRMLPTGEFNVMIPELRVTLQGAATGQIQWHVIPEPCITLQGAANWRIQCHDSGATCHIARCCHWANSMACHPRAMYHIAGCCHLVNSLSRFQSHMPHCRVQSPDEISVMIVPHCRV